MTDDNQEEAKDINSKLALAVVGLFWQNAFYQIADYIVLLISIIL